MIELSDQPFEFSCQIDPKDCCLNHHQQEVEDEFLGDGPSVDLDLIDGRKVTLPNFLPVLTPTNWGDRWVTFIHGSREMLEMAHGADFELLTVESKQAVYKAHSTSKITPMHPQCKFRKI